MFFLLELKENINKFYNRYNQYIVPAVKFIIAFASFMLLNLSIGYMPQLRNPIIALGASVVCAFIPTGFTILFLAIFMVAHLYAISAEFAIIALCVVFVMYLLYFRFSPKYGYLILLTVICCWLKVPFILPVAIGLSAGLCSIIPATFGILVFYIIRTASEYEAVITNHSSVSDSMQQLSYIVESFVNGRDWSIIIGTVVFTIVVVYFLKRLCIDNAWTYAIVIGTVVQFVLDIVGILLLDGKYGLVFVIIGNILGLVIGYICQIVFFSVDYKRTEYCQYEDDDYYYYVKAVPKISVANQNLKIKHINARTKTYSDEFDE